MSRWTGRRLALPVALAALGLALNGSPASAISLFPHVRVPQWSTFNTDVELQGLYDEMSEVYVPAMAREDVKLFDEVVYAPDWVFIDSSGHRRTLAQMSANAEPASEPDSLVQRIDTLTPVSGGVTALVTVIAVHTFVDTLGHYGAAGMSHTKTEITPYRDSWVDTRDGWRMTSREQVGPSKTRLDKPEWGL